MQTSALAAPYARTPGVPIDTQTHASQRPSIPMRLSRAFSRIPETLLLLLARFSMALTFWLSGQTKVEGLVIDPVNGMVSLGWPHLSEGALELFATEYRLPLLPPETAALMAASAEHVLPLLLIVGLGTRYAALGMLVMTLTIQIFVYPSAYPTHALWATALLLLMAKGAGPLSIDHLLARRDAR